jgi:endonuclease YncB( thermonuclease family)
MPLDTIPCPSAYVVDGDFLRCGSVRVRFLGIDAPELHGCPPHRQCVSGNGQASRRSLVAALRSGRVTYRVITYDRYGRSVASVWAGGVNLSCWQLQARQAVYKPRWDNGGLIARKCR